MLFQSYGSSGMTIIDELTDMALRVCEKSRQGGQMHLARGASLLTPSGKVYCGCDVYSRVGDPNGISAERSAIIAAVADGISKFEV